MLGHNLVLKHNELYLVGESHAEGSGERATGLYARDTRFLDWWDLRINGEPLVPLACQFLGPDRALVTEANSAFFADSTGANIPVRPLTIAVEQHVTLGADLQVRICLTNYSGQTLPLKLSLEVGGDFRDLFDIRGFPRPLRGGVYLPPVWQGKTVTLGFTDRRGEMTGLLVEFSEAPTPWAITTPEDEPETEPIVLLPGLDTVLEPVQMPPAPRCTAFFPVTLGVGASWELLVTLTPIPADDVPIGVLEAVPEREGPQPIAQITTSNPEIDRVLERAAADLSMLRTSFKDGRMTAAGIPWFVAPFGRDSTITALQSLHIAPHRAVETLRMLAALQGHRVDAFREEEPGKILHEMRYGEMARLGEIPHSPYYGSVDATPLFVMLFAETVRWTADEALYRELLPHARQALEWMEHWGDRDGDLLVEYVTRPADGAHIVHQGWKDSYDSLHYANGQPVHGTIALVEVQGYVYAAHRWLSDVAAFYGDASWAAELRERAEAVRRQVEERFWLPEVGYYAQALDGEKRPVTEIASNAGHLLYCGLPSEERARAVAARLRWADLDSGWGVRTLAVGMTAYNPMSYHNGSVWPHDNSLIAAGLGRYGETEGLQRIASALFTAAERLPNSRLPELYCGFSRDEATALTVPVPYPVSCSPQAWAAGSVPLLIRAMLGLEANLERGVLRVAPALPEWIHRVHIEGMHALGQDFDLGVERDGSGYRLWGDGPVELDA